MIKCETLEIKTKSMRLEIKEIYQWLRNQT